MAYYITKASGERELFNQQKFKHSLERAGASAQVIAQLLEEMSDHPELTSTAAIYRWALSQLKKQGHGVAARYNLKQALLQLGPTGFPFEKYMAHLMQAQGYTTQTDQIIKGTCVSHEVDLTFAKDDTFNLAECKFHNSQALTTAIQVPLYVKARFDDILSLWQKQPHHPQHHHEAWVITNTRFTSQATDYGTCAGLKLLSWAYPQHAALRDIIDRFKIHPVTALTSLTLNQKKQLVTHKIVLCKDITERPHVLKEIGMQRINIDQVIAEAQAVCKL